MNELRDPHEPVIPGSMEHPAEGHGGVSMPIGVSGNRTDPHEPVLPVGQIEKSVSSNLLDITDKLKPEMLQSYDEEMAEKSADADSNSETEAQGDVSSESQAGDASDKGRIDVRKLPFLGRR